jgi:hypothetical protein
VTRYATKQVTEEYIKYLEKAGMVIPQGDSYLMTKGPIKSFGETLEWFIAQIFRREFYTDAVWGLKMKMRTIGGDYDLLAKIDGSILYMEIKSSPPKQIYQKEISAFFERVYDMMPEIAIFLVDTELRMKDKIVPMFEDELKVRFSNPPVVKRMERELFEIMNETERPKMFIINTKDSIINNIEKVLIKFFRKI